MVGQLDRPVVTPDTGWSPGGRSTSAPYAIQRRGLQAEIQQVVKRYIIDHRFRPGDPLPGEGELARQLGISRPSLREAMKVLQTIGAVETRHGSGTYVGELSLDALADGLEFQVQLAAQHADTTPAEMLDLVDIREGIETHLIRRATGRHTAQQVARMRDLNQKLATLDERSDMFVEIDGDLHVLFYEPLGSRLKSEFMHILWRVSTVTLGPSTAAGELSLASDHSAIIDALVDGNRDAAVAAMSHHMRHIVETIERSYQPRRANGRSAGIAPVHPLFGD